MKTLDYEDIQNVIATMRSRMNDALRLRCIAVNTGDDFKFNDGMVKGLSLGITILEESLKAKQEE